MPKQAKIPKQDIAGVGYWLLLGFVVIVVGIGFYMVSVPVSFTSIDENTSGFSWSPHYGFTSFNDCYCTEPFTPSCPVQCWSNWGYWPYGVEVDFANRRLSGWMWSNSVGAICMGQACVGHYSSGPPSINGNSLTIADALYDEGTGEIDGWAKIISWPEDSGWLSLRGDIEDQSGTYGQYGLTFETSTFEIVGLAWNGFLKASSSPWYTTPPLFDISDASGYGWFCMSEPTLCPLATVQVFVPYVTSVGGDMYVQGDIEATFQPNIGYYNSMYLILATGDIVNFVSQELNKPAGIGSYVASGTTAINLPSYSSNYLNIYGLLDVPNLGDPTVNQYGDYIDGTGPITVSGTYSPETANNRLIIDGDLYVGDAGNTTTLLNGSTDGSLVVVVKGDLYIENELYYQNASVSNIHQLATAVFIVEGDMFIDPDVSRIDGNFVVLGNAVDPHPACPSGTAEVPSGCGAVYTGDSDNITLTVNGVVIARKFFLQRTYADVTAVPSEEFVYDGRLLVNPPQGFVDFSKSLPVFGEAIPQ